MNHHHDKTKPQLIKEIESLKNRSEELEQAGLPKKYKSTDDIKESNGENE